MPDPRFFNKSQNFSVKQLAEFSDALVQGDSDLVIEDVASLDKAEAKHVSFLDNVKYKEHFLETKAGACFVHPEMAEFAPANVVLLITESPYKSYALAAQAFYPDRRPEPFCSEQACIHETAVVPESCIIHPGVVIEGDVVLGESVMIEAGAVIKQNVEIGAQSHIGPNAVVSHAIVGEHVRIYPGAKVGQDGFGFAMDPSGFVKVPQLGRVIIEDHVEIGANTTIDRGAGPDTVIGQGTWIDNLAQIGHNVRIGKGCVIVSQVGISGSTVVEDYVVMGGQVGVAGHLNIGKGVRIAAQSGIMRDIPAGQEMMGYPAVPIKEFMRQVATLKRLIQKNKKA